jgi:hypothetical protein
MLGRRKWVSTLILNEILYNLCSAEPRPTQPRVKVVSAGEAAARPKDCRGTVVGPGVNQPEPFPGYGGFVGFESPVRLKSGAWLVGFNAGYWHESPPTPVHYSAKRLQQYRGYGMPANINAPTGGRAMITRSTDAGRTWSRPVTLIDTPANDVHPSFVELRTGTILCSFFRGGDQDPVDHPESIHTYTIRSYDGGRSWEQKPHRLPSPFLGEETDGPMVPLKDGSVLLTADGSLAHGSPEQVGVLVFFEPETTARLGSYSRW